VLLGDVERQRRAIDAGVVDEDVDAAELAARALDHGREVGALGDVGRQRERLPPEATHLLRGALGALGVELGHHQIGAEARQLQGGGAAMPWPPPVTMATRPPSSLPSRTHGPEYTAARARSARAMVCSTPDDRGTAEVRDVHRFDVSALERYLSERIEGFRGP